MRTVVFGGAVAALVGLIFGAGMKAPIAARDLPQPELQQVSYPVETIAQESYQPEYVVATAYTTTDWANPHLWQTAYEAPAGASTPPDAVLPEPVAAEEPALNADQPDPQAAEQASPGDPAMPYAAGMTTRVSPVEDRAPEARPASSWPNKRGDTKQQVLNGSDGFEHLRGTMTTDAAA